MKKRKLIILGLMMIFWQNSSFSQINIEFIYPSISNKSIELNYKTAEGFKIDCIKNDTIKIIRVEYNEGIMVDSISSSDYFHKGTYHDSDLIKGDTTTRIQRRLTKNNKAIKQTTILYKNNIHKESILEIILKNSSFEKEDILINNTLVIDDYWFDNQNSKVVSFKGKIFTEKIDDEFAYFGSAVTLFQNGNYEIKIDEFINIDTVSISNDREKYVITSSDQKQEELIVFKATNKTLSLKRWFGRQTQFYYLSESRIFPSKCIHSNDPESPICVKNNIWGESTYYYGWDDVIKNMRLEEIRVRIPHLSSSSKDSNNLTIFTYDANSNLKEIKSLNKNRQNEQETLFTKYSYNEEGGLVRVENFTNNIAQSIYYYTYEKNKK